MSVSVLEREAENFISKTQSETQAGVQNRYDESHV